MSFLANTPFFDGRAFLPTDHVAAGPGITNRGPRIGLPGSAVTLVAFAPEDKNVIPEATKWLSGIHFQRWVPVFTRYGFAAVLLALRASRVVARACATQNRDDGARSNP